MVSISLQYEGSLHCTATHGPSGAQLPTDAPRDNLGLGAAFSPTDLVATALGTCIVTTMAIVARRKARIVTRLTIPLAADHADRAILEAAAHACPVHQSLHPEVEKEISFDWTGVSV